MNNIFKFLSIAFITIFFACSSPKEKDTTTDDVQLQEVNDEVIFNQSEESPEFIGGMDKLYVYIAENIQYPENAKENEIQGDVYVQFIVWKDGTIKDVEVVKGSHEALDNEAMRVIKSMPKWTPGKHLGDAVNVRFTLPIKFKIP